MNTRAKPLLAVGLRHSERLFVEPRHTVPQVEPSWPGFQDMPAVLATAMMVAFIEETCIRALRPFLSAEERSVGTHVAISHIAPTPVGMNVTAEVVLTAVEGKALHFRVTCRDESGLIGEGTHRRAIIDIARFNKRLQDKASAG